MKKFEIEKALHENEKQIKEKKDHIQSKLDAYQQWDLELQEKKQKEIEHRRKWEMLKQ